MEPEIDSADVGQRWTVIRTFKLYTQNDNEAYSLFNMKTRGTDGRISKLQILGREDESAV